MRAPIAISLALATVLAALTLGCRPPSPPPLPPPPGAPREFSAELAWEHLRALVEIGPRPTGSEGLAKARGYIKGELEKMGLETEVKPATYEGTEEDEPLVVENILAAIPGASEDLIVLVAPYDTRHFEEFSFLGANDGGSGAALLLELARAIAAVPLPYTTWIVFLDGESHPGGPRFGGLTGFLGSTAAAIEFQSENLVRRTRLLMAFNRVGDADLRIARDLRSHRVYREQFWRSAERLGHADAFDAAAPFESPRMSHVAFLHRRLFRVVAITDTAFGGDEPPGIYADTEDDNLENCSPESLKLVGDVTLEALDQITRRLVKIDQFSRAPLAELEEPEELEPGEEVSDGETAEAPGEPEEPASEEDAFSPEEPRAEPEAVESPTPDSGEASTPEAEGAPLEPGGESPPPPEQGEGERTEPGAL
jgi:hypothetical protein